MSHNQINEIMGRVWDTVRLHLSINLQQIHLITNCHTVFRILSTSLFLICCNNFLRTINRTSKCILKSVQHSGSEPTSKTDQVYFMGLLAAGQRNLGRGIGLIISLLVFYFEETWHEKQTFPLTPRCLVTNQILTINSANYT